jgi:hypothetical protein
MPQYHVGKPYVVGCTLWPEASLYAYRLDGHELILLVRNVTARQEADLCAGTIDLALVADEREIVLCARFGASLPWSHSAPFHWREVPQDQRGMPPSPESSPNLHAQLRVTLVEADSGLVQAQRTVFLPRRFTSVLNAAIRIQARLPANSDRAKWSVARIYRLTPVGHPERAFHRLGRTSTEEQS